VPRLLGAKCISVRPRGMFNPTGESPTIRVAQKCGYKKFQRADCTYGIIHCLVNYLTVLQVEHRHARKYRNPLITR
jgi:hypothetical protein